MERSSVKNNNYTCFCQSKNITFANNIEEIAQNISQILPFSKIALLCFKDEYFNFGRQIIDAFCQKAIRVIEIILCDNFTAKAELFQDFLSLPEDVRGVVVFNHKLIPLVSSNYLSDKSAFFIDTSLSALFLRQPRYYIKDNDLLKHFSHNNNLNIIINTADFKLNNYIKSACLCVNMLIDYIFRQKLTNADTDTAFVNKTKALLIDILFCLQDQNELPKAKLIEKLIFVSGVLAYKDCYYSCSAIISSFIDSNNFFDLQNSFSASKVIMKNYDKGISNKTQINLVDYRQTAKAFCFSTQLNQNQVLSSIYSQVEKIKSKCVLGVKEQVKKLILLYNNFLRLIKQDLSVKNQQSTKNLLLSIGLSGITPFGLNGLTALQE